MNGRRLPFIDPRLGKGKFTGISIKLLTCPLTKRAPSKGLQSYARAWLWADFGLWSFLDETFGFALTGAQQARLHPWSHTRSSAYAWKAWTEIFSSTCKSIWKRCFGISALIAASSGCCRSSCSSYRMYPPIFSGQAKKRRWQNSRR